MATIEPSLFDWRDVEARSDLDRFFLARDHLPDARLLQYLEVMRAGRNRSSPDSLFCRAVVLDSGQRPAARV